MVKLVTYQYINKISPIYKKDKEELLENYRPVSIPPILEKSLKKLYSLEYIVFCHHKT